MKSRIAELEKIAIEIRKDIVEIAHNAAGAVHLGPSLSSVEIMTALYFGIMDVDIYNPLWENRDRFILSKGHATPALYATLAEKGFFDKELLNRVRYLNSPLEGHPIMNLVPGIDLSSGSLGNGLSAGMGMAYYLKNQGLNGQVFVLLGDGECQEGNVWEAALVAPAFKLDNLIAIVDNNKLQSTGKTDDIVSLMPLRDKWESMNWNVYEINGNDMQQVVETLEKASEYREKPSVIIANTIKGKGISFMENDNKWHQNIISEEQYMTALGELNNGN